MEKSLLKNTKVKNIQFEFIYFGIFKVIEGT